MEIRMVDSFFFHNICRGQKILPFSLFWEWSYFLLSGIILCPWLVIAKCSWIHSTSHMRTILLLKKTFKTLWHPFMGGVQLSQGCRVTSSRQSTFYQFTISTFFCNCSSNVLRTLCYKVILSTPSTKVRWQ